MIKFLGVRPTSGWFGSRIGNVGRTRLNAIGLLIILWGLSCHGTLVGGEPERLAREKVAEGVKKFSNGNFDEAVNAFSEAAELDPENVIIKFDKACALMATGEDNSARELLLQSALSKDTQIASAAYYNLACIAVKQGRNTLGAKPLEAQKETRDKAIERLQAADAHFRDCLRIDPSNKDARHNLELLRSFLNHIQAQWRQLDRQQELEQLQLFALLERLDDKQGELRESVRQIQSLTAKAVPRFERQKISKAQSELSQDAATIEQKVQQLLSSAKQNEKAGSSTQNANSPDGAQDAESDQNLKRLNDLLSKVVQQASLEMKAAGDDVMAANWSETLQKQRSATDRLREIYALLQEVPGLIGREITMQEQLLALHQPKADSAKSNQDDGSNQSKSGAKFVDSSAEGQAWQQQWITQFTQALAAKARSIQKSIPSESGLDQESEAPLNASSELDPKTGSQTTTPSNEEPTTEAESKEQEQLKKLRVAINRILEVAPEILDLSDQATSQLAKQQFDEAKLNQLQILKLLKELNDLLPKQPPDKNQKNSQDEKNKDQKDQQDSEQDEQQKSSDKQEKSSDQQNSDKADSDKSSESDPSKDSMQDRSDSGKQNNEDTNGEKSKQDSSDNQESTDQKTPNEQKQSQPESAEDKSKSAKPDENKPAEKSEPSTSSNASEAGASEADKQQQAKQLAEQRAQAILRRIREREAKYRELLQQLRELQGKRSPVDKDW